MGGKRRAGPPCQTGSGPKRSPEPPPCSARSGRARELGIESILKLLHRAGKPPSSNGKVGGKGLGFIDGTLNFSQSLKLLESAVEIERKKISPFRGLGFRVFISVGSVAFM